MSVRNIYLNQENTPSCHSERSEESSSLFYTGDLYDADLLNGEDSSLSLRMTAPFLAFEHSTFIGERSNQKGAKLNNYGAARFPGWCFTVYQFLCINNSGNCLIVNNVL